MSANETVQNINPAVIELVNRLQDLSASRRLPAELAEFAYGVAFNYYSQGQYESAMQYFAFLTVYRPTETRFLTGLAQTHRQLGNHAEAIRLFSLAGMIEPLAPEHTLAVAECELSNQQTAAAFATLQLVIDFCKERSGHDAVLQRASALKGLIEKPALA
ncbi:tetratricopeptide repeat protein [Noviherbaspirillum sp. CPCC 100848]|uniref:Tetratricopeptide repeat protein n=1 Tax=Noviherbaspirillum album TaxID=3080276 RepID=A0ABU6JAQ8_9BURK|nr:tetratricopeptide repeat protein [Noviherbaspirillum sp. CPCC 100848]MEC4720731.1 tetratricopeptide repeat protein [Noviherbaspirillum sp. CPCC 100848]